MPLDRQLYEEMVRRGSRASLYWLIGNRLYHTGLLIFIGSSCLLPLLWYLRTSHPELESSIVPAAGSAAAGICVFFLGGLLKTISYRIAGKEGIDTSGYRLGGRK